MTSALHCANKSRSRRPTALFMILAVIAAAVILTTAYQVSEFMAGKDTPNKQPTGLDSSDGRNPPVLGGTNRRAEISKIMAAQQELKRRHNGVTLSSSPVFNVLADRSRGELPVKLFADSLSGPLTGEDVKLISQLDSLREIRIIGDSEEGSTPDFVFGDNELEVISRLPHLEVIDLFGTQLTDDGIKHFASMKSLQEISVSQLDSSFTAKNLEHLASLKNLRRLNVDCRAINMSRVELLKKQLPECAITIERTYTITPTDDEELLEDAQDRLRDAIDR